MAALHRIEIHDFDGVLRALGLLQSRFRGVQAASGTDGVAADHRHLFNDDNLGAEFVSLNSSRKAGAARADNRNVDIDVFSGTGSSEAGHDGSGNQNLLHLFFPFEVRDCALMEHSSQ